MRERGRRGTSGGGEEGVHLCTSVGTERLEQGRWGTGPVVPFPVVPPTGLLTSITTITKFLEYV